MCTLLLQSAHSVALCTCVLDRRFSDSAVSEEAAEHQFQIVQTNDDLSEAWFQIE